jgi:hypothetical protein
VNHRNQSSLCLLQKPFQKSDRPLQAGVNDYIQSGKFGIGEAAAEIQALLEQLSKTYPSDTISGNITIATEAIKSIESNPSLMEA